MMTNREKAAWLAELYQAVADGKTVQFKENDVGWVDQPEDSTLWAAHLYHWRIKPEPRSCERHVLKSWMESNHFVLLPKNWEPGTRVRVTEILEDD